MESRLISRAGWLLAALAAVAGVVLAPNTYWLYLLGMSAAFAIVGIGLNLLIGLSGQISLGHAGFFAVGAYVAAILTTKYGWSWWAAAPLCLLIPAALGAVLAAPALRVRGPYLAMVTIAFGLVLQNVLIEAEPITGGFNGISNIDKPLWNGDPISLRTHVGLMLGLAALSLLLYVFISGSRFGKLLRAVRDSEIAARSIGINPLLVKTAAFVVSAALAGLAGGLFAPMAGFISPENFDLLLSIQFLLLVILGGLETRAGPLLGAVVIAALPEALSGLAEYRLLFFGALLFLILAVMPRGIAGSLDRWLRPARHKPAHKQSADAALLERVRTWLASQVQPTALKVDGIGIRFGGLKAVDGLSFEAQPGQVTGLIGPNGAGKTSVLNILGGFYQPSEGSVRLGPQPLPSGRSEACARAGIARTFQTTLLFDSLTVLENVELAWHGKPDSAAARDLLRFAGFEGDPQTPAADLPFVDRRMVEIARALALRPRALLLDEPAAGLGKGDKARLAQTLGRIAESGVTVVLVEHDIPLVMQTCKRLVAMENGKLLRAGSAQEVQGDPAVIAAYLGVAAGIARSARQAAGAQLLRTDKLSAGYGRIGVLKDIGIEIREHEVVAIVGSNGAGKSTLMRALTGLLPAGGSIGFKGAPRAARPDLVCRSGLVMVPEGRQVFPRLSVRDNLLLGGYARPAAERHANLEKMLERFPRLRERVEHDAGLLSGGEQQMLAIARGLMAMPDLIIFDEPSLGLAPKVVQSVYETIDRLAASGMTVLLVDQFAAMALSVADRGYVLSHGRLAAEGQAAQLLGDDSVKAAYLGEGTEDAARTAQA